MLRRTSAIILSGAALCLALVIAFGPGLLAQTSDDSKDTLARKYDVIIVKGEFLKNFNGLPINKFALLASRDGKISPIPFQIDERDRKGHFVMTSGKTAGKDEDNGNLDPNDELVFCISDAGDRLPEADRADKIEIELTDPRYLKSHAWAYLAYINAGAVPRSTVDYVNYDAPSERIVSKNYILGYRKGYMFYNDLIYPVSAGGNGKDFFDRIKFRIKVEFLGGKMTMIRNEDMVKAEVQGWIDGPVRVLQSTINYVKILDVLPPASFNSISEYYPYIQTSPIIVKFPFDLTGVIKTFGIKSISTDVVGDMPGLVGGNAITNLCPNGFVYTGKSTPEELAKIPKKGLVWGFASKKGVGTWFPRLIFPDVMYQFNNFYITDDESYNNPPDDVPGEIGAGLTLDLKNYPNAVNGIMSNESFMMKFETYFAPPGLTAEGAREWLDIQDYPPLVDTHPGKALGPPPVSAKVPSKPPWKGGCDGTITDIRDRKITLKKIAFFVGGIEVDARDYFMGERVTDATYHSCPLAKIKQLSNHYVDFEPKTKTRLAMFSKITMLDGSTLDLLGCRSCVWGGLDDEGRVVYLPNSQVKSIEFSH